MPETTESKDEWSEWWDARMEAMASVLDKADDVVGHAMIPFQMGAEVGGAADVVYFRNYLDGVACATSELIGCDDQVNNLPLP